VTLRDQTVLRPMTPASAADCNECGRRCRVEYVADTIGKQRSYINCGDCGLAEIDPDLLQRWEIDTRAMLAAIFRSGGLAIEERIVGQLWQVGKATWAGRSREVWFARTFRRGRVDSAVKLLRSRPKAIVFAPTEAGAQHWHEATGNLVVALDLAVALEAGTIRLDTEYVEGRIVDAGMGPDGVPKRPPKKRSPRTAKIESLKVELVRHLRAARDHAFFTKDETGTPELLPRPTQKDLGFRVGLSASDVSRCLSDEDAGELRLYWNVAADLDEIMRWHGGVKQRGNRTRTRPLCHDRKASATTD